MPISHIIFYLFNADDSDVKQEGSIDQEGDMIGIDPEQIGVSIMNRYPQYDICKCKYFGDVPAETGTLYLLRNNNYEYEVYDTREASKEQTISVINKYPIFKITI